MAKQKSATTGKKKAAPVAKKKTAALKTNGKDDKKAVKPPEEKLRDITGRLMFQFNDRKPVFVTNIYDNDSVILRLDKKAGDKESAIQFNDDKLSFKLFIGGL